jgi:hypothetical protein
MRRDWEFMQGTGVFIVQPRIEFYGAVSTNSLASDFNSINMSLHVSTNEDILTTPSSGALNIVTGTLAAGTAAGYLVVSTFNQDFLIEPGDRLVKEGASGIRCLFKRWGYYTLTNSGAGIDQTSDVAETNKQSFRMTDYQYASGQSDDESTWEQLTFVNNADWLRYGYDRPTKVGRPTHITMNNAGAYAFYPPPDDTYHLYFEYTRTPEALSAYGDSPTYLPARFHNAIVWKALMYWAEYEGNGQQYQRAERHYKKFESDIIRDCLPAVSVSYDARHW